MGCASTLDFKTFDGKDFGQIDWYLDSYAGHNSPPSFKSGPIENTGQSGTFLVIRGPATVSFWWTTDANYYGNGQLIFLINGDRKYVCASKNSRDWIYESYPLKEGKNYTLTWEFVKFKTYPKTVGSGWIDDINVTPGAQTMCSKIMEKTPNPQENNNLIIVNNSLQGYDHNLHIWKSIEDAVEDAYKSNISKIIIKKGNYTLNTTIVLRKAISIEGQSANEVIIKSNSNNITDAIHVQSDSCRISNLSFDNFHNAIYVVDSKDTDILNNCITNTENGIFGLYAKNLNIISNRINSINNSGRVGIYLNGAISCKIYNNMLSGENGIYLDNSKNTSIKDNYILDIKNLCIKIVGSDNSNIIHHNQLRGAKFVSDTGQNRWSCNYWLEENCSICVSGLCYESTKSSNLDSQPYCEWVR
jgi:parallel beta-helix repeat protein